MLDSLLSLGSRFTLALTPGCLPNVKKNKGFDLDLQKGTLHTLANGQPMPRLPKTRLPAMQSPQEIRLLHPNQVHTHDANR